VLTKQLHDLWEQIEQAHVDQSTFKFLQTQEEAAIRRRINALMEDVNRQTERERSLQMRFAQLQDQLQQCQLNDMSS
jgi:pre-mRNA-splicing factor CDC5/CEF1